MPSVEAGFTPGRVWGTLPRLVGVPARAILRGLVMDDGRLTLDVTRRNFLAALTATSVCTIAAGLAARPVAASAATIKGGAPSRKPFPKFKAAYYRVDPESDLNTAYEIDAAFGQDAVDVEAGTIHLPDLPIPFAGWGGASSAKACRCWFETTGTLPGGLSPSLEYYLAPAGRAGRYWIYPVATAENWPSLHSNVPNALLGESVMPAQYLGQAVNRIHLTSAGSGRHSVRTRKRLVAVADADGGPYYTGNPGGDDLHKSYEVRSDGRKSWIEQELLFRTHDDRAAYNLHGLGAEQGPADQRLAAQAETSGKRALAAVWALRWGETDTFGIAKVPFVAANVDVGTGRLTFTGRSRGPAKGASRAQHGLVTGYRARLLPRCDGGVLPAGWRADADYFVYRVDAGSLTLHASPEDAATGLHPVLPSDEGKVGFLLYCPDRPADHERARFIMELRRPDNSDNRLTTRSNYVSFTQIANPDNFVVSGAGNGNIGGSGLEMEPAVPTDASYREMRIFVPEGAEGAMRRDTGQPLKSGRYWMTRAPGSATAVRLHQTKVDAVASLGVPTARAACIKYTAAGTAGVQIETVARYLSTSVERGAEPNRSTIGENPWAIPVGEDGVLTVICDYNDPRSDHVRTRTYWGKALVQDWQSDGAKGPVSKAQSPSMPAWTLLNSPDGHVTFEGRLYGGVVAASNDALTIDDLSEVIDWYSELLA